MPMSDPNVDTSGELSAGLDALDTPTGMRTKRPRWLAQLAAPLVAILAIALIWELVCRVTTIPDFILPTPGQVWNSLINQFDQGILMPALGNSLKRAGQGFLLSIVIATPIGILLGTSSALRAVFRPILTGLQQLPSVAWVPAAIIWFGLSDATIYAVILLGAIPSIANGLISGIDQIPPIYLRVGEILGAGKVTRVTRILLPASWPGYLAGLEQGWAFAWRSLMAAELIAVSPALGPGLGQMLDVGRQLGDMSLVLASILSIMFAGILVERLIFSPLRQRTLRSRGLVT